MTFGKGNRDDIPDFLKSKFEELFPRNDLVVNVLGELAESFDEVIQKICDKIAEEQPAGFDDQNTWRQSNTLLEHHRHLLSGKVKQHQCKEDTKTFEDGRSHTNIMCMIVVETPTGDVTQSFSHQTFTRAPDANGDQVTRITIENSEKKPSSNGVATETTYKSEQTIPRTKTTPTTSQND